MQFRRDCHILNQTNQINPSLMASATTEHVPYSAGILSLIPLFYVAWADKMLTPSEVRFLRQRVNELELIDAEDQALIDRWSDPSRPPSRELFKQWEMVLQEAARDLPANSRASWVDLAMRMAESGVHRQNAARWSSPDTRRALEELVERLGLIREETYQRIFEFPLPGERERQEEQRATFPVGAMASLLDGENAEIRRRVQTLLQDPVFRYRDFSVKEDHRELVLNWCRELARQGFGSLAYPLAQGGSNDMGAYMAVFETLGYHDLSLAIKFGVQFGLFGGSVLWLGTERHHARYLSAIGALDLPGCFAMTETGHGSNVRGLDTTITYDPESAEFVVHSPSEQAGKEYIGNALHGRMATVFGQLIVDGENHGIHAVLVPLRDEQGRLLPGIRFADNGYKMGLNGVDNGRLWFDHVRAPRENLLNRFGEVGEDGAYTSPIENPSKRFFTMIGTLVGGRVSVPRAGLSAAKAGLTIAIRYALRRRQFGPSYTEPETLLLDYPSHQRRLLPLLAKTYALHFALQELTRRFLAHDKYPIREIETLAAGLKAYSTWFTTAALQECREACGGKGYLSENRLPALKADTDIFTTFEGDNTVLLQLVARGLLTRFQQEFSEEGVMGVLRFVGENVAVTIRERNPITVRNTSREHLLDPDFHQRAFAYRQDRLTYSVSQRLRRKIKGGRPAYEAYLEVQTHMLTLAQAFVERFVVEQFYHVIDQCTDERLQATLSRLAQLFALHTIESHKGWYLEQGYLEGNKTRAIRYLVDELCAELRPESLALVEAFAIPDSLLGAEILK